MHADSARWGTGCPASGCGGVAHVKTWTGWAYLAIVIDLHSRAVVGWAIADNPRTGPSVGVGLGGVGYARNWF